MIPLQEGLNGRVKFDSNNSPVTVVPYTLIQEPVFLAHSY